MKNFHRKLISSTTIVFYVAFLLLSMSSFAQKVKPDDVPTAVKTTFTTEFPNAKVKEWQISGDKYVVIYKDDGSSQKTTLSNTGVLIETRIPISKQELPGFISDYTSIEYPGFDVSVSELIQVPKSKDIYSIELKKSGVGTGSSSLLTFSSDGKLLSRKDPEGFVIAKKEEPKVEKTNVKKTENKPKKEKEVVETDDANNDNNNKTKTVKNNKNTTDNSGETEPKPTKNKKKGVQYPENIISENSVPPIVKKNFLKKFPKAEEVRWFNKKGDTIYQVKCYYKLQDNEIFYTKSGKWLMQKIELDEKTLFPAVQKYLDKTYRKYKFVAGMKTLTWDKNDGFEVSIIELKNKKSKLETKILFDKMGKLVKTIDPDYTYDEYTEKETTSDRNLEKEYSNTATNVEDDNNNGQKVTEKELPSEITTYVYANYPGMKIKSSVIRDLDELGMCYEVSVAREGVNQETVELIFDKLGKFIKNANETTEEDNTTTNKKAAAFVPAEVVLTGFKTKHPKATKVVWEQSDNDFIASFTDGTGAHKSYFSADGNWTKTSTTMNPETVSPNIKTYVEKNHKGYKIIGARNVKKADKKTYYEVDIQNKKNTDNQTLEFNQAGKPVGGAGDKD
jgi:hypothetical protein